MKQLRRTSHRSVKPAFAPVLVVRINSPVPTMEPARMSPGPIFRSASPSVAGGGSTAFGESS
jgi:hypothetical protein